VSQRPVALVTGSSRGIGRAIIERLADSHDCVVHYRSSSGPAEEVAQRLRARGARVMTVAADIGSETDIDAMFDAVTEEFGRLDVLVASAAATKFATMVDTQRRHLERTLSAVVLSYHQMVSRMLPLLRESGRIVAVSGLDARFAQAGHGALGAAKAALESLTRSWAVELAPRGCTVNAVLPGAIDTDSLDAYFRGDDEARAAMVSGTPVGRLGTVGEVADIVAFLCSQSAAYVTGHVLVMDGGASAEGGAWSQFRDLWNS
jgi:enoyl-[acyl-carrier protein] reductase III